MHSEMPEWFRLSGVQTNSDHLDQRATALDEFAKSGCKRSDMVAVVRVLSHAKHARGLPPDFVEALRKADSTFTVNGSENENRLLAGALLRIIMEGDDPKAAVAAAYGLMVASFASRASPGITSEHALAARNWCLAVGRQKRNFKPKPLQVPKARHKFFDEEQKGLFGHPHTPKLEPIFTSLLEDLSVGTQDLAKEVEGVLSAMRLAIEIQREETNLLWWLQGKHTSADQNFAELGKGAALALAFEVADLALVLPASEGVEAILATALTASRPTSISLTIAEACDALSRDRREQMLKEKKVQSDAALPLATAIAKSLETPGPAEWVPVYKAISDVSATEPLRDDVIAKGFLKELFFYRAVGELKEE